MNKINPVIDCLMNHCSVRKFKPEPIPEETIETILRAGTRAATAGSIQPYAFIVVDDPKLLKKVSYIDGPLAIVAVVDQYRVKRYYEASSAPFSTTTRSTCSSRTGTRRSRCTMSSPPRSRWAWAASTSGWSSRKTSTKRSASRSTLSLPVW